MSQHTTSVESPVVDHEPRPDGPEEALESHQVIELQTFIDRKAWIEEKIKLLEKMPPIEVFVGLDALALSAEQIPGLPSRSELQQWIIDHDAIEKETEIFDTGELKKLRNFTRAATQRNLSPEDTDLIELTLTTIYELDKLLHLLRDRSENLDLLGIRLTWEEHRSASWRERRKIIADLDSFLNQQARWSASVYSQFTPSAEGSDDPLSSPAFSKTTRHGFADSLSRDAAQFASRVSTLHHGSITSAGKVLDKLIDNSRKPVPDVLLDEQDRLEEQGINDMENVGKFVMNAVMQWRKADEIYVETLKDQTNAKTLVAEIEAAKECHPNHQLSTTFIHRADGLSRRLTLRGNPGSRGSSFPCPIHPLFAEQESSNASITSFLSSEINLANTLLRSARTLADEYRARSEAVQRVESLINSAETLSDKFVSIIDRFENGVSSTDADGSPPSLMTKSCLEPTKHSDFLALLPSLKDECVKTEEDAEQLLKNIPPALLRLDFPGIQPAFKSNAASVMQRLSSLLTQARSVRVDMMARAARLRESRKIWETISLTLKELDTIRKEIGAEMETARWKDDSPQRSGAPPTPESPIDFQLPTSSPKEINQQLDDLNIRVANNIDAPLASLRSTLENPLRDHLVQSADSLKSILTQIRQMAELLESLKSQSAAMSGVRSDYHDLQLRIENLKVRYDECIKDTLNESNGLDVTIVDLDQTFSRVRSDASSFISSLPHRLPFISGKEGKTKFIKRSFSSFDLKLGFSEHHPIEIPFDLQTVDASVRSSSNTIVMRLNGDLYGLEQKANQLSLSQLAKELDVSLSQTCEHVNVVVSETARISASFADLMTKDDRLQNLEILLAEASRISSDNHSSISRSFAPLRSLLKRMEEHANMVDPGIRETLFVSRGKSTDDAELRFTSWDDSIRSLSSRLTEARDTEHQRLEELKRAEAARTQREKELQEAEQARLAAEAEAAKRLEEQRRQEAELRRREEEQAAEDARIREEKARKDAEEARLEQEHAERAERQRIETERLEEERRQLEERQRLALEEAEHARLQRERSEMEVKLRLAEQELAEQRRKQAEKDAATDRARILLEQQLQASLVRSNNFQYTGDGDDVFGSNMVNSHQENAMSTLYGQILKLRRRLSSLNIKEMSHSNLSATLPTVEQSNRLSDEFKAIQSEVAALPAFLEDPASNTQLKLLKLDLESLTGEVTRVEQLATFLALVEQCDTLLSDLLEHIDSYPDVPSALAASYRPPSDVSPESQLSNRLQFTTSAIDKLTLAFTIVGDDGRAQSEHERILQTWSELEEMAKDRFTGRKSRPSSAISSVSSVSSGRISSTSKRESKASGYSKLSSRGSLLPPGSKSRRAVSSSMQPPERPSTSTRIYNRSTSGPLSFSPYGATFSSRQRTTSLTQASIETPKRKTSGPIFTPKVKLRSESPTVSDPHSNGARSSTSMSTWSRAPRLSFVSVPRTTPQRKSPPRKTYVANPKNKLDVAVGDVVNNLPVGISIEGVSGSWKDQSGKYWIGDQDPKLCFCRILRSQTVMVRVGGGWTELSKFIRGHFAECFRLLDSPPHNDAPREEKWISATTLLEAPENGDSPPAPPKTPEPRDGLPSFSLVTPTGSPHSLKSTPSTKGSPLTALQFMRRAEPDAPLLRPETPSKMPLRSRTTPVNTPARTSIWRP